jgi:hypothetical protein
MFWGLDKVFEVERFHGFQERFEAAAKSASSGTLA